ncbi:hypothetical protein BJ138DRAFT_998374 [Hygrophoropsis aurantiaca]|uniref:Uncharacterized protein n=1 Tax=Hygrophoropsis aurantiaca TaxID=72124 RepID=A0ACB8ANW5_9AGAM|nr:hypothetical protein BJ138DRAFT_998374 [Hygrophoropsis aurantiaca]
MFFRKSALSFLYFAYLCFGLVGALRVPSDAIVRRQEASSTVVAALSAPTSITTTNIIQTANGPMTETCILTFTPVGESIQEVQNCTMSMGSSEVSSTVIPPSETSAGIESTSATPTAAAAFVMPGRSLEVLPVGLGVFGGISAIVVIVVAVVTYERTQYRKAFRLRKQAQSDAMNAYSFIQKKCV